MRMLTLVLLLSLLWAALAHAQDQPITNGSFETVGPPASRSTGASSAG